MEYSAGTWALLAVVAAIVAVSLVTPPLFDGDADTPAADGSTPQEDAAAGDERRDANRDDSDAPGSATPAENTVEITDRESDVRVEATAADLDETDLVVTDATPDTEAGDGSARTDHRSEPADYQYGPVVHVQNRTSVRNLTVTIPFGRSDVVDTTANTSERRSVYAWTPGDDRGWRHLPTEVDPSTSTATATIGDSSFLTVFDPAEWTEHRVATLSLEDRHLREASNTGEAASTPTAAGHWPLDWAVEAVPDRSGANNYGRIVGDANEIDETDGAYVDAALDFGRTDSYVEVPSTERLRGGSDARITGSAWFRPTAEHHETHVGIVGKQVDGTAGDWGLIVQQSCPDHWTGGAVCEGEPPYVGYYSEVDGDDYGLFYGPIERYEWNHAAFVLDQPNETVALYNDGELVVQDTDAPTVSASTDTPIEIGSTSYRDAAFEGAIDEARVYDRALTAHEIERLYVSNAIGGVELRDSTGDGIPDAVAEANPPLPVPVGSPAATDPSLAAITEPIDINSSVVDTDGDGLPDAETLDVRYRVLEDDGERRLKASVGYASERPARNETHGGGLAEREQFAG